MAWVRPTGLVFYFKTMVFLSVGECGTHPFIHGFKVMVRVINDQSELVCTSIDRSSFNHNFLYRALFIEE